MKHLFYALLVMTSVAHASNVAVVDSGTDLDHRLIKDHLYVNTGEIAGDRVDQDRNGKVDDARGWNFVEGSNLVFERQHLRSINSIVYPAFTVIAHKQAGTNTPAEDRWFEQNVTALPKEQKAKLMAHLNYFGQYAHSTHVSGIVLGQNPSANIMSARVFPNDPPPLYGFVKDSGAMDWLYKLLAIATNGTFHSVSAYLHERQMDVANYSLGMSLQALARASLQLRGNKQPTDAEVAAESRRLYQEFDKQGRAWMAASPGTLFVIAAGNDGTDNDVLPAFPGNVRAPNSICVAASQGYRKLAYFSNYGKTTVDVAAPGVAIMSAVPSLDGAAELPLSGTSMAAPFVTGVASRVKDLNSALGAADIRRVLMETVDKKAWLVGKVISGGVVNASRAAEAARLAREMDLDAAIARAVATVADQPDDANGPASRLDFVSRSLVF